MNRGSAGWVVASVSPTIGHMNTTNAATVTTATRRQLGRFAGEITQWRTERYLDAGFYDHAEVDRIRRLGLPIESSRPDDFEVVAIDRAGSILATLSIRRPTGSDGTTTVDAQRPRFGFESVHGTGFLAGLAPTEMKRCWEAGRFLRDRNVDCSDAVVAVTTAAAHLLARLAGRGQAERLVGEVEPGVALRHLDAFGLPMVIGAAAESPSVTGVLHPRYHDRTLVPFALDLTAINATHLDQWRELARRSHLLEEPRRAA